MEMSISLPLKGWHYTTLENWRQIRKHGLRPYKTKKQEWYQDLRTTLVTGIWVWEEKPEGENHLGNILRVCATQNTTKVCFLEVEYNSWDRYRDITTNREVRFSHHGNIENFVYHRNSHARIITKVILPQHIRLLGYYDLIERMKNTGLDKRLPK